MLHLHVRTFYFVETFVEARICHDYLYKCVNRKSLIGKNYIKYKRKYNRMESWNISIYINVSNPLQSIYLLCLSACGGQFINFDVEGNDSTFAIILLNLANL